MKDDDGAATIVGTTRHAPKAMHDHQVSDRMIGCARLLEKERWGAQLQATVDTLP